MLDALLKGPAAYSARTGWPAWAVIPAALGILALAALIGVLVAWGYSSVTGLGFPTGNAASGTLPQAMLQVATWTAGLQIGIVLLTLLAAGFFSSNRAEVLALESARKVESEVPGLHLELGGGIVGVTMASNQALHHDHQIIIPMVMLIAFVMVMAYYSSVHAGWLMVLPMLFSTTLTYAYMGAAGIGINVNTVPVIAVGVGVGIDYAVYFMDRIREEMAQVHSIHQAVVRAVATTGYAVSFTAVTLVAGVVMWVFLSDLRFQSDAALLLSFMLIVNAIAAMLIVPAWCVVFKPHFVVATHYDEEGVLEEDEDRAVKAAGGVAQAAVS